MIDGLKPYPKYKDSGVPWLGEVPEHWEVRRNGRLFAQRREVGFPDLPILEVSLRTGVQVRDLDSVSRKQVIGDRAVYKKARAGDIAYNMMRMWQGAAGVAPVDGLVSPAYVVARPFAETDSRFFEYLFRTPSYMAEVNDNSRGIVPDRNRLYWDEFKNICSPTPPREEQRSMVRFLRHVDRAFARYVRAKKNLIALLNEQKQVIIHRAVTRGLNPNVRLQTSEAGWIGEIPEGWKVVRNKSVCRLGTGHTPSRNVPEFWVDCTVPWFTLNDVHQIRGDRVSYVYETREYVSDLGISHSAAVRLPAGTVILSRTASVGFSAILGRDMATSQDFMTWTPGPLVNSGYLLAVLRAMRPEYRRLMRGSTHQTIYMPALHAFRMPLPPHSEQVAITGFLDSILPDFFRAVESIERQLTLMLELRTRLISDVVTGKLDVREAAARLTDEVTDDELPEIDDTAEEIDDADMEMTADDAEA